MRVSAVLSTSVQHRAKATIDGEAECAGVCDCGACWHLLVTTLQESCRCDVHEEPRPPLRSWLGLTYMKSRDVFRNRSTLYSEYTMYYYLVLQAA